MEIRIADTFTASLARLTADEQKAVKITALDLQIDPSAPGLQFHRIDKSKDRNFWSLRVSRDIRIIIHKTAGSILLCYADHHDRAYTWAERRRIEQHPRTGTIQIVEVRERVAEFAQYSVDGGGLARSAAAAPLPPRHPFAGVTDDAFLGVGVPEDWIDTIRTASEDEFLDFAEHVPPEAAEALLQFAATGMFPAPVAEPTVARATLQLSLAQLDFAASTDSSRRFRVVENVEELERALDFPREKWSVFLHPSQQAIVDQAFNGPARVAGSAGTGKTVVALHRAARLAQARHARVLLTTFSEPLANALRHKLRILLGNQAGAIGRVTVATFRGVARELFELHSGRQPAVATEDMIRTALTRAAGEQGAPEFSSRFLFSEWINVIDAWQIDSEVSYADVPRLGRKNRLGAKQRTRLWPIFEAARRSLDERGIRTWSSIMAEVAAKYGSRKDKPFTHIVVDEAQDLAVPELHMLGAIAASGRDALFFAGDLGQRIFQQPFSWKALGIDVRGRSHVLRVNYRTSHQIRLTADRLLPNVIRDVDGLEQLRASTVSVFNGPAPAVERFSTPQEEQIAVGNHLRSLLKHGISAADVAVFVRGRQQIGRAREAVRIAGEASLELSERVEDSNKRISIGTMHLAKGLEYKAVIVMACDGDILPLLERIEAAADEVELDDIYETERQLLYVACTRARDRLIVTGVSPVSEFLADLGDAGRDEN